MNFFSNFILNNAFCAYLYLWWKKSLSSMLDFNFFNSVLIAIHKNLLVLVVAGVAKKFRIQIYLNLIILFQEPCACGGLSSCKLKNTCYI